MPMWSVSGAGFTEDDDRAMRCLRIPEFGRCLRAWKSKDLAQLVLHVIAPPRGERDEFLSALPSPDPKWAVTNSSRNFADTMHVNAR